MNPRHLIECITGLPRHGPWSTGCHCLVTGAASALRMIAAHRFLQQQSAFGGSRANTKVYPASRTPGGSKYCRSVIYLYLLILTDMFTEILGQREG